MSAPEHSFGEDVLKSGDTVRSFVASAAVVQGEPVTHTGDYEVGPAADGGPSAGVAMAGVEAGEAVPVAGDGTEVLVDVSAAVASGDALTPDGAGGYRQASDTDFTNSLPAEPVAAVANEAGGAGDTITAILSSPTGGRA